jgi:phage shock protein PspC (stress-responsive transcriptional regulator)
MEGMSAEDEVSQLPDPPSQEPVTGEPEAAEPTGLRRSTTRRMIGGVASGIGERFDIDANVVRAVFVILACLWGFGAAVYLILWVLVPRAGEREATNEERELSDAKEKRRSLLRTAAMVLGVLCIGLLFLAFYTHGPRWGSGVGAAWLVFLVILAVLSFRGSASRFTFGRLLSALFLVVVSLVVLVGGGFLAFVAMTGVPITGGIGDNVYAPTTLSQVHSTYRTSFGVMTVNLAQVPFADQKVKVTATVAVGRLTIEVPAGVVVDLTAQSGVHGINYPQGYYAFYVAPSAGTHQAHLELKVKVGVGQLRLVRSTFHAAPSPPPKAPSIG